MRRLMAVPGVVGLLLSVAKAGGKAELRRPRHRDTRSMGLAMRRFLPAGSVLALAAGCCLLASSGASAGTTTSLYGTINCFGLPGVTSCPNGSSWETGLGGVFFADYRDAFDLANAPLTDIWNNPIDPTWKQPSYSTAGAVSASLSMRIAGIADVDGPYTVTFDGTGIGTIPANTDPNAFQEVLTYTFSVPVGLLDGNDTVSINTAGGDGFIIDYSELTAATAAPEPATLGLFLLGSGALAAVKARRRRTLKTTPMS